MTDEPTVGRIDLGPTEPRQPTQTEQRVMDGALRRSISILPELLRVDVGGVSVFVRGQTAYDYLVRVNHKLAVDNKALHAIAAAEDEMDRVAIAAKALGEMKSG